MLSIADDSDAIRAQARRLYADPSDDNIEIDDDATVENTGDQTGFWVAAWLYVTKGDVVANDPPDENPFHHESPEGRAWEAENSA